MKYIKLFNTDSEYQEFASDIEQPIPNVSYVIDTNEVHYILPLLWAVKIEPGCFICGDIEENILRAYVIRGSEDFFYGINAGGVINGVYTLLDKSSLLDILNNHYGTAFTDYVPVELPLYNVGQTFPNWSSCEKIIG